MLNSAITISEKTYRNQRTELTLYAQEDDYVEVIDSQFSSENQFNGGAINILKEASTLSVARTTFHHCFASYRGGAISFFGKKFVLSSICFLHCETSDSAMAIESHLDAQNSSIEISQVVLVQCADEDTLQDFRFASIYLILGTQSGRHINSTKNDASHGGSFAATEDCDSFDIQYVHCHNNSGRSTFEFEDLTQDNSIFALINIMYCRRSYSHFQEEYSLFVLTGSVMTLQKSSVFLSRPTYIVMNGDLTFYEVKTDLAQQLPVQSGSFRSVKSEHSLERIKTVKLKGFNHMTCSEPTEGPEGPPPTASIPKLNFDRHGNKGILTFLLIAGGSGIALFLYYMFWKKPDEYERLEPADLVDLPIR